MDRAIGIIQSPDDVYLIYMVESEKKFKSYSIARIIAFQYETSVSKDGTVNSKLMPICDGVAGPNPEIIESSKIQFIGTKKKCEEKASFLKKQNKENFD